MRTMRIISFLIVLSSSTVFAWEATKYDTVEVRWENGNLREYYTRACFEGYGDTFQPHGQYKSWFENGQLKENGTYRWNRRIGTWIKWDENGNRREETTYIDNAIELPDNFYSALNGQYIEWYPDNTVKTIGYYKYNSKYGLWIIKRQGDDRNNPNLMIDSVDYYYRDTLLVRLEKRDGEWLHSTNEYYNAEMDLWIEWKRTHNNDWLRYYTDFYIGRKVNDKRDGKWLHLDPRGEIVDVMIYRDGQEVSIK
ncbi:MAG: hypothetical protein NT002_12790 [candidate division Zixibacteria bacterium]|nr:hypothetical protein [candidate division Zixibacteria bacterium]